jgi:ABC-2 type transport system permease protein
MLKSTPFIIIMTLGLVQLFTSLTFVTSMYGNTTYPVTYNVVDVMPEALSIYLLIIVAFYAGQLIWKERDPKIDGIVNALPMATRTGLLAKAPRWWRGWWCTCSPRWPAWPRSCCTATHACSRPCTSPTSSCPARWLRLLGSVGDAGACAGEQQVPGLLRVHSGVRAEPLCMERMVDVESNLVAFNGTSGLAYSDMNGFGPFLKGWLFFKSYWTCFAGLVAIQGYSYVRGNETTWRWRLRRRCNA